MKARAIDHAITQFKPSALSLNIIHILLARIPSKFPILKYPKELCVDTPGAKKK